MINIFHNYRDFKKKNFIYKDGAPKPETINFESGLIEKSEKAFLKTIDIDKIRGMKTKEERFAYIKKRFDKKHHPDKIAEQWRKIFSRNEQKLKAAVNRYKRDYNEILNRIYKKIDARTLKIESDLKKLYSLKMRERANLRADVDSSLKARQAEPNIKKVTAPAPKRMIPIFRDLDIPIISPIIDSKEYLAYKTYQRETTEKFTNYTKALNTKYLESAQHNAILNPNYRVQYKILSDEFKTNTDRFTRNQLEFIFKTCKDKKTLKSALTFLQARILAMYEANDIIKKDGILDLIELRKSKNEAHRYMDVTRILHTETDEESAYKQLEKKMLLDKGSWIKSIALFTNNLINDVERDGSNASFTKGVKELTGSKENMSYEKAKYVFKTYIKKLANTGVKETMDALDKISKATNGERNEILELNNVSPPSIRNLVLYQRGMILSNRLTPKGIDDKHVTLFMRTNLEGRLKLLKNPHFRNELFQAIQNIKKHYPAIYNKQYLRQIPKKISKIQTRCKYPDMPTSHDKIARLLAMLTLAKEAEWVIKNLDKSHLKGQKIAKRLDQTHAEKIAPSVDMKFKYAGTLHKMGYVSRAERGGLNARNVAIGAVKVWAGLVLIVNLMNARRRNGSFIKGAEEMLQNPYFLGTGGLIYGLGKYQQNPNYRNYFKEGPGGQARIATHTNLSSLAGKKFNNIDKVGKSRIVSFVSNKYEFKAMKSMFSNPRTGVNKVRQILKKSEDRARKNKSSFPIITREDMKRAGLSDSTFNMLPPRGNERMRFLFYKRFLLNSKLNVRQLQNNCKKWR